MLLILTSKEKKFYNRKILLTFLLGLTILILSETSQRFIDNNFYKSFIIFLLPIILIIIFKTIFTIKLNLKDPVNDNI
jgi:uncharacterized membrane protein